MKVPGVMRSVAGLAIVNSGGVRPGHLQARGNINMTPQTHFCPAFEQMRELREMRQVTVTAVAVKVRLVSRLGRGRLAISLVAVAA